MHTNVDHYIGEYACNCEVVVIHEQKPLPIGAIARDALGETYVVEGILGQGGFSSVYKVRKRHSGDRIYALKEMINPAAEDLRNMMFEAEVLM